MKKEDTNRLNLMCIALENFTTGLATQFQTPIENFDEVSSLSWIRQNYELLNAFVSYVDCTAKMMCDYMESII